MSSKRYRLTAAREYETAGTKKTAWVNLGTLWIHDDGRMSGVLESVPVGTWFDGRIHAFRADDEKRGARSQKREPDLDDDIPF